MKNEPELNISCNYIRLIKLYYVNFTNNICENIKNDNKESLIEE